MSQFDLRRLRSSPLAAAIEHHAEIASTSDRALEIAKADDISLPLLVLTVKQTGGRGRASSHWWASEGSLTFSILLEAKSFGIQNVQWPVLSLSTDLAI